MRRLYRAPSHQVQSLGKDPDVVMVVTRAIFRRSMPSDSVRGRKPVRPVTTITSLCEPPHAALC